MHHVKIVCRGVGRDPCPGKRQRHQRVRCVQAGLALPARQRPGWRDADQAGAARRAALEQRVARIDAKISPWVYAISSWETANVKKKMEHLLAPRS